jgi:hypothetical protein
MKDKYRSLERNVQRSRRCMGFFEMSYEPHVIEGYQELQYPRHPEARCAWRWDGRGKYEHAQYADTAQ